ncbi:MAG TPA: hypothetical protein VJ583_01395 [Nitrososphaeraceae archaeon]|nr:hypothetical protein [Nitrososphaeraceae archaeon]
MSAINFKRGSGLGDVNRKKISSFAECWKGKALLLESGLLFILV